MTKFSTALLLGTGLALVAAAGFVRLGMRNEIRPPFTNTPKPIGCTEEAKQCPDGSYVGRTLPACEFAECPAPTAGPSFPVLPGSGTLSGTVRIGPLCPVEPCPVPHSNPYASRAVTLTPQSGPPVSIPLHADGTFESQVPVGTYALNLTSCVFLGCASSLPKMVVIRVHETTTLTLDIDTGIR